MKPPIERVLGTLSDPAIGRMYGISKTAAWRMRRKLGISAHCGDHSNRPHPGNRRGASGHWPKGTPRNDVSPRTVAVLEKARQFFAEHAILYSGPNPRGITACARDCKMSLTSLRDYLKGRYVPCARNVSKLEVWLQQWK